MNIEQIGPFILKIPYDTSYSKFKCEDYYGIHFTDFKIEVLDNKHLGCRINIKGDMLGDCRDIPLNESTFHFLPAGIDCKKIQTKF